MKIRRIDRRFQQPPTGGPVGRAGEKQRTGDYMDTPSRPRELPTGPAPASFDIWSISRLSEENRCVMEQTYSCVPLQDDPICTACWRTLTEVAG